jgi:hypothetical protein
MIPIRFLQDPHQISPKKSIKKTLGIFKNETPTLAKHFILQNVMLNLIMHCMCSFNYTKNFFKYFYGYLKMRNLPCKIYPFLLKQNKIGSVKVLPNLHNG